MTATVAQAQPPSAPEPVINTTSTVLAAQQHRQMPAGTLSQPQTDIAPAMSTQAAAGVSSTQPAATEAAPVQHAPRQPSEQHAAGPLQQAWAVQLDLPSVIVSAALSAAPVAALSAALAGGPQTEPCAAPLPLPSLARPASPALTLSVPPSIAPLPVTTTGVSSAAASSAALSAALPAASSAARSPASVAAASAALTTNSPTFALASVPIAAQMASPVHQSAAAEPTPAAAVTGQTHQSALAQAPQSSASSAAAAASGHANLPKVSQQTTKQMPVASDAHIVAQMVTPADQLAVTDGGALPSAYANLTGRLKPSVSMSMRPRSVAIGSKAKVPLKSGKLPIERPDLPFEIVGLPSDQPLSAAQPSDAVFSAGALGGHALQQSLTASVTPPISLSSNPAVAEPSSVAAAAHPAGVAQQTSTLALHNGPDAATASKGKTEGAPMLSMDRPEGSTAEPMGRPEGQAQVSIGIADGSGAMLLGSKGMPGRQESVKGALPALSRLRDDKQTFGVAAASTVPGTSSKDRDGDRHTSQDRHRDR